jgi:hypothetical protein
MSKEGIRDQGYATVNLNGIPWHLNSTLKPIASCNLFTCEDDHMPN